MSLLKSPSLINTRDTIHHVLSSLNEKIQNDDTNDFKNLLMKLPEMKSEYVNELVIRACNSGSQNCLREMFEKGADADTKDASNKHILFITIEKKISDCAINIVINGGPKLLLLKSENNKTPVYLCVETNNEHLLEAFCTHAKSYVMAAIDTPGPAGTALCLAVEKGQKVMVEILIGLGANPRTRNAAGQSPLHIAARKNKAPLMEILLNHQGMGDIDIRDINNRTPLHLALQHGAIVCAEILVKRKANCNLKDDNGDNAFHCSAAAALVFPRNLEIIALMLSLTTEPSVHERNYSGGCNLEDLLRRLPRDWMSPQLKKELKNKGITFDIIMDPRIQQISIESDDKKIFYLNKAKQIGLTDASWAGGSNSKLCTLIITEGESAMKFVLDKGFLDKRKFGLFALKGKPPNVYHFKNLDPKQKGQEIPHAIFSALGASFATVMVGNYTRNIYLAEGLRYGHVLIMTDQDPDGFHIKGLLLNMFYIFCPDLVKQPNFIQDLPTNLYKATNKFTKEVKVFKLLNDFEMWKNTNLLSDWDIQYYKGLSSNSIEDVPEYFTNIGKWIRPFVWNGQISANFLDLAFGKLKKSSTGRKMWLVHEDTTASPYSFGAISYSEFLRKEMIFFLIESNKRALPSVMDVLKPSQRKTMYYFLEKDKKNEGRIAIQNLQGMVASESSYHHRVSSLGHVIARMASQKTVLKLLEPAGYGGAPTYSSTRMMSIACMVFREEDNPLLQHIISDDGKFVEPKWYAPVIPLILINGCSGIGCGYNSTIPRFDETVVIQNLKGLMNGDRNLIPMSPLKGSSFKNMHLFNAEGILVSYNTPEQVLFEFYEVKLQLYGERKKCQEDILKRKLLENHTPALELELQTLQNTTPVQLWWKDLKDLEPFLTARHDEITS